MSDSAESGNESNEEIIARLEALDDVIFPAIDGDQSAIQAADTAWRQALTTLGSEAIQESRREYLRHARVTWNFLRNQTLQHPHQILALAKIIMMLTGDDAN